LHLSAPNLTTLILTNNNISELGDLEPLMEVKGLKYLSLLGNPVREKKWYREWLAWRLPGLRVLDFQRIRDKVRALLRAERTRTQY
jgi:U2 small nuclear ribonucleoprotein A'